MKKYVVIEVCDSYMICHGTGLTWAEAHLLVMSQMMNDEYDGNKTRYYILDDPGNMV